MTCDDYEQIDSSPFRAWRVSSVKSGDILAFVCPNSKCGYLESRFDKDGVDTVDIIDDVFNGDWTVNWECSRCLQVNPFSQWHKILKE